MKFIRKTNLTITDEEKLRKRLFDEMNEHRGYYFYFENFFGPPTESDSTADLLNNYYQEFCAQVKNNKLMFETDDPSVGSIKTDILIGCVEGYIEWYNSLDYPSNPIFRDYFLENERKRKFAEITWSE